MENNKHRSYTINNWKKYGIKSEDYKKLYNYHMSINNCQMCNVLFDDTIKNQRCLDHDHNTGLYRKTICRKCNAHYLTSPPKFKRNMSGYMFITIAKTKNKSGKYSFSWRFQRKDSKRKCFKSLTKALSYSFIQLLKNPLP